MDEMKRNEMKKFLRPSFWGIIAGGAFLALGLAGIVLQAAASPLALLGICVVLAAVCSFRDLKKLMRWNAFTKDEALVQKALADYTSGVFLADNNLCIGGDYAIGRNGCAPVSYDSIAQVYEYVHKTNFSVDARELRIRTKGGDMYTLCKLPQRGLPQDELLKVFALIKLKNNSIYIGYK